MKSRLLLHSLLTSSIFNASLAEPPSHMEKGNVVFSKHCAAATTRYKLPLFEKEMSIFSFCGAWQHVPKITAILCILKVSNSIKLNV